MSPNILEKLTSSTDNTNHVCCLHNSQFSFLSILKTLPASQPTATAAFSPPPLTTSAGARGGGGGGEVQWGMIPVAQSQRVAVAPVLSPPQARPCHAAVGGPAPPGTDASTGTTIAAATTSTGAPRLRRQGHGHDPLLHCCSSAGTRWYTCHNTGHWNPKPWWYQCTVSMRVCLPQFGHVPHGATKPVP